MKRRDFITAAGLLGTVIVLPFQKIFGIGISAGDDTKKWTDLIDYARWCPSPHNVQPWKMKLISKKEAHLYYDPTRVPFTVDRNTSFTIAGMGMFIECLNIAARQSGNKIVAEHEPEEHLEYNSAGLKLFAKLYLVETDEKAAIDPELIKQRRTSRLHYDGRILSAEIVAVLRSVTARYGHNLIYSSDKELIEYVTELNARSIVTEADNDDARNEMSHWIRTTDTDAEEKKDGLWYRCLDTSGRMLHNFFFKHQRFTGKWKRKMAEKMLTKSMRGTANIAWITGRFENRNHWVNAGIMLQHLWLEMTKYNVYMHPLGTIVTTQPAYKEFCEKINFNETENTLWLLVRLGYSNEPPRSFRLETKDILMA